MNLVIPIFTQLEEFPLNQAPRPRYKPDRRVTLSAHEVATMRLMHAEGYTHKQIWLEYPHCSKSYVFKIINNTVRTSVKINTE